MRELNIRISAEKKIYPVLFIDKKRVKCTKSEKGEYFCSYKTENSMAKVEIIRPLEVNGRLWFLTQMLLFIVSIFGIFNARLDRKCINIAYEADVYLKEKLDMHLKLNPLTESGQAVVVTGDALYEERQNMYFVDQKAKKRKKILLLVKGLLWVAAVITGIVLLIVL